MQVDVPVYNTSVNATSISAERSGRISRFRRGCARLIRETISCGCVVVILFLGFLVVAAFLLFSGYNDWVSENRGLLAEIEEREVLDEEQAVTRGSLEEKLTEFRESEIQKEVMTLSCEEVEILMRDVLKRGGVVSEASTVGVVCRDRAMDIYVKAGGRLWVVVKVWQRAEGAVDFMVYDVEIGGASLASQSMGYVTEEANRGIGDAMELISSGNFSGRQIEELYLTEDGMRVVGSIESAEVSEGVSGDWGSLGIQRGSTLSCFAQHFCIEKSENATRIALSQGSTMASS